MKAQVALEFFIAIAFTIIVFYWSVNYSNEILKSSEIISINTQQKIITKTMARVINEVCILEGNLTLDVPCLFKKEESLFYFLSSGGRNISIANNITNASFNFNVSCNIHIINMSFIRCEDYRNKICLSKNTSSITITNGACP